jgi:hypothetical protein
MDLGNGATVIIGMVAQGCREGSRSYGGDAWEQDETREGEDWRNVRETGHEGCGRCFNDELVRLCGVVAVVEG